MEKHLVLKDIPDKKDQTGPVQTTTTQTDPVQTTRAQCELVQTTTAQDRSTVNAPVLQGNEFHGPVNVYCGAGCKHEGGDREGMGESEAASSTPSNARTAEALREAEREKLKKINRGRYERLYEGTAAQGKYVLLNEVYSELHVVEDWRGEVNTDHEVIQMEARPTRHDLTDSRIQISEIFHGNLSVKKVLTIGIAGIGKTISVQKFALDWAEGKSNTDVDFVFVIAFRELNLLKDEEYDLQGLLLYFYPDLRQLKEAGLFDGKCKCAFIFDGLDELRKPLDFEQKKVSSTTKKAPVEVLVTNLITGALLPSALVWITSRPAAADQISSDCIDRITEVRGFITDQQKEEYFRKRIRDEEQANRIISHIKQLKTLYIMCYIPVFCWITCIVLQEVMKRIVEEIPKTVTQMYAHFLTIQMDTKSKKYNQARQKDTKKLLESNRTMLLKLAELAFRQLLKGNVMFYEEDLRESGIDITEASVYSGVFTEILREECMLYQRKVYCFVHLSFQEFLAAVYVFHCYQKKNMKELQCFKPRHKESLTDFYRPRYREWSDDVSLDELLEGAVDEAVWNQNRHLDLFLRFLLGISVESNQRLLQGLLTLTHSSSEKTTEYIKSLIKDDDPEHRDISAESSINLFLCLSEMKDQSLSREIQEYLKSEKHSGKKLSPGQCSALAYMLLTSEKVLEELDPKKYNTSEQGYRRLVPAVSICRKAILAGCALDISSYETICSALRSESSPLKELDLSYNNLPESVVDLISAELKNSHCRLETLRLAGCNLTTSSNEDLCSALKSVASSLKDLDLSNNDLQDSGVELLSAGLKSSQCKLQILRLANCGLGRDACEALCSALKSVNFSLNELDLSNNDLQDSGVELLSAGLKSSHCKLQILRLVYCGLGGKACEALSSALQSVNSSLIELDLSNNDLQDSGVELLSAGLKSSHCKLQILRLSGCMVTDEGCSSLDSVLKSNPSHLRELDLTYNHPAVSGVKKLSDLLDNQHYRLDTLRMENGGKIRMKPGLKKWACDLTLDPNTAHRCLSLSEGNRKVECVNRLGKELLACPDNPERFDVWYQVMSVESLTGRCYWEAEWVEESPTSAVVVALTYKPVSRKGNSKDCCFGEKKESWSLKCCSRGYSACHSHYETALPPPPSSGFRRVGVYVDYSADTLSFYSISSDTHTLTHLHTFNTTFTQPLYAGIRFGYGLAPSVGASVCLCKIE